MLVVGTDISSARTWQDVVDLNVLCSGESGDWGRDLAAGSVTMPLSAQWELRMSLGLTSLMTLKLTPSLLGVLVPTGVRMSHLPICQEESIHTQPAIFLIEKGFFKWSGSPFRTSKGQKTEFPLQDWAWPMT